MADRWAEAGIRTVAAGSPAGADTLAAGHMAVAAADRRSIDLGLEEVGSSLAGVARRRSRTGRLRLVVAVAGGIGLGRRAGRRF